MISLIAVAVAAATSTGAVDLDRRGPITALRSSDGLVFSASPVRLLDSAGQPDVVLLAKPTPSRNGPDAGALLCFAAASEGQGPNARDVIRRILSTDQGRSWSAPETVRITGWPAELDGLAPASPAAIQLDDARIRLYFTIQRSGSPDAPSPDAPGRPRPPSRRESGSKPPARVYSAVSNDGLLFAFEEGVRFELDGLSDPDVLRLPDPPTGNQEGPRLGPWLMLFTRRDAVLMASSADGLSFARNDAFVLAGAREACGIVLPGGDRSVRIYARQTADGAVISSVLDPRSGKLRPDNGSRRAEGSDPSVAPTGDGATLLVLVERMTDKPAIPHPVVPRPRPDRPLDPRFPPTHPEPTPPPVPR